MPTRRQALVSGAGTSLVLLAGCVGPLDNRNGDDEAAADTLRNTYDTAYDHFQSGRSNFGTMFDLLDEELFEIAHSEARSAEQNFANAAEEYSSHELTQTRSQIWGDEQPEVHYEAFDTMMTAVSDSKTASILLFDVTESGQLGTATELQLESIRDRFNGNEFELPQPRTFDEAV